MSSDIKFLSKEERTIAVDIRYVLLIIDKYAGDHRLINELSLHKTAPKPQEMKPQPMAQQ